MGARNKGLAARPARISDTDDSRFPTRRQGNKPTTEALPAQFRPARPLLLAAPSQQPTNGNHTRRWQQKNHHARPTSISGDQPPDWCSERLLRCSASSMGSADQNTHKVRCQRTRTRPPVCLLAFTGQSSMASPAACLCCCHGHINVIFTLRTIITDSGAPLALPYFWNLGGRRYADHGVVK